MRYRSKRTMSAVLAKDESECDKKLEAPFVPQSAITATTPMPSQSKEKGDDSSESNQTAKAMLSETNSVSGSKSIWKTPPETSKPNTYGSLNPNPLKTSSLTPLQTSNPKPSRTSNLKPLQTPNLKPPQSLNPNPATSKPNLSRTSNPKPQETANKS